VFDRFSDIISPKSIDQPEVRGYLKKMQESQTETLSKEDE